MYLSLEYDYSIDFELHSVPVFFLRKELFEPAVFHASMPAIPADQDIWGATTIFSSVVFIKNQEGAAIFTLVELFQIM